MDENSQLNYVKALRKCGIETILYGEERLTEEKIDILCQEEIITKKNTSKIGFL
ncbi:MAG: hypothetical protein IJ767_06940 [Bacteroidaceae bacterium]|nr:hypothetical protein [Bacteroidaceae bacterium]